MQNFFKVVGYVVIKPYRICNKSYIILKILCTKPAVRYKL